MGFEVSKRHILRPTLSIDLDQRGLQLERQNNWYGRRKKIGPMVEK